MFPWSATASKSRNSLMLGDVTAAMQLTRKLEAITDRIDVATMERLLRERNSAKTLPYLYSLL